MAPSTADLPPTVDGDRAAAIVKQVPEADPPYGARVHFSGSHGATGWNAPPTASWLARAAEQASQAARGKPVAWIGEGGTIPFMSMFGEKFPSAQFLITGVLGPHSNAHGPNEFLHLDAAKRLTAAVASIVADVR